MDWGFSRMTMKERGTKSSGGAARCRFLVIQDLRQERGNILPNPANDGFTRAWLEYLSNMTDWGCIHPPPPDPDIHGTDLQRSNGAWSPWKMYRNKSKIVDHGGTDDVTWNVKVKMLHDFDCVALSSITAVPYVNEVNKSTWIVSGTLLNAIECITWTHAGSGSYKDQKKKK